MEILRLYYKLPPLPGGMENHIYYLTKFQNIRNNVTVFYNQGNPISLNDKKIIPFIKLYKLKPMFIGTFIFYFLVIFKLAFLKKKFDVIHIHGGWCSLVFVKILKKITKSNKIVFTNHGLITNSFQHRYLLPKFLSDVDLIFSTGYESARILNERTSKNIFIQPSGVDEVFYKANNRSRENKNFNVVTVANLVPVKNLILVIEIAKKLIDVNFFIIGQGSEKDNLMNKINEYGLSNVKILGHKSLEEIKDIHDNSDCFLFTSLAEGTPTSILEAMASGLPIVSSNAGGIDKIVLNNINGFVINNYEKDNYIKAIELLKNDINLRKKIFLINKEVAKKFIWENVANNITQLTIKYN